MIQESTDESTSTFVHLFQSFINYQKNVLETLVTQKLDCNLPLMKHISSENNLDTNADSHADNDDIFSIFANKVSNGCKIHILCSHITHNDLNKTGIRFPFIQYMLEKPAFNHNQFTLPSIFVTDLPTSCQASLETQVVNYISKLYRSVFPAMCDLTVKNSYVGACHLVCNETQDIYVLLDVSHVWSQLDNVGLSSNNPALFILPSEIINSHQVCNMAVDEPTIRMFSEYPELSKLQSVPDNQVIPVPDVGYTVSSDLYTARLECMFGPRKTIRYNCHDEICDAGFAFSADICQANTNPPAVKALTRYAVYYDTETDDNNLIRDYDLFLPLTFHILNPSGDGIL